MLWQNEALYSLIGLKSCAELPNSIFFVNREKNYQQKLTQNLFLRCFSIVVFSNNIIQINVKIK